MDGATLELVVDYPKGMERVYILHEAGGVLLLELAYTGVILLSSQVLFLSHK